MILLGTVFFFFALFVGTSQLPRRRFRLILSICYSPFLCLAQDDCLDPQGDCTLANPVTFELEVPVSCGDTVLLSATQELCNTWTIPTDVNYQFGTEEDSLSIFVIVDQCFSETIYVDGITNTPSGGGFASCDTRLVYTLVQPVDTTQQGLPCAEYFALASTSETLQSSCGCDSLFVEYFNLGGADTTFLTVGTCLPEAVSINTQELTASTGCDSLVITSIELDPLPDLLLEDQQICEGEIITLYAFTDANVSYLWNTGATTPFLEVMEEGQYSVTITDSNGCTASSMAQASYGDLEIDLLAAVSEPYLLSENPLRVWQGAAIELAVQVSNTQFSYEVVWNQGPEIGDTTLNYIAQESGEVTVAVIDSIGCIGTLMLPYEVRPISIFVPSAFSPNHDDINDLLNVYTSPNIEEVRLQLFSRTGSLIYDGLRQEAQPAGVGLVWSGWDGTFNGTPMPPQVFVYQLSYRALRGEWQNHSGDVILIR